MPLPQRKPQVLINVDEDGNCLAHALSVAITGRQNHDKELRKLVTDFQREAGEDEEEVNQMSVNGVWMRDKEINAFARILKTPIYVCAETSPRVWRYERYPYAGIPFSDDEESIFIANIPRMRHFQVVKRP